MGFHCISYLLSFSILCLYRTYLYRRLLCFTRLKTIDQLVFEIVVKKYSIYTPEVGISRIFTNQQYGFDISFSSMVRFEPGLSCLHESSDILCLIDHWTTEAPVVLG